MHCISSAEHLVVSSIDNVVDDDAFYRRWNKEEKQTGARRRRSIFRFKWKCKATRNNNWANETRQCESPPTTYWNTCERHEIDRFRQFDKTNDFQPIPRLVLIAFDDNDDAFRVSREKTPNRKLNHMFCLSAPKWNSILEREHVLVINCTHKPTCFLFVLLVLCFVYFAW